jgi:hypothetical protein
MRLGFDLDGTVADMQTGLAREARTLFREIDPASLPRSSDATESGAPEIKEPRTDADVARPALSVRQQRQLWKAVCARHNFWETLDEIEPGALARLSRLVREHRWELLFLTSRPETDGDTAQLQSYRWLVAHGFESPSVFVVHGSRGKVAAALHLDVLVDDRPENCVDVAIDSTARAILVWRGGDDQTVAAARRLGIGAVASVAECLDILERLSDGRQDRGSMLESLKRLLGLKNRTRRSSDAQPDSGTGVSGSHVPASERAT